MTKIPLLIFGLTPNLKVNLGISGSDDRFVNILKNIPKKDIEITLVGTDDWVNKLTSKEINFNHIQIKSPIKGNNKINISLIALINIIKTIATVKLKKDYIIYSTSDLFWETIPAFFYRRKLKYWIQVVHHIYPKWYTRPGNIFVNLFGHLFQKLSLFLIKKRADLIIVINPNVKYQLIKSGIPEKKIFTSSNAINFVKKTPQNIKYDAVFLGRLDPSKGLNDFVPIWELVCQQIPNAKLALVGGTSSLNFKQLNKNITQKNLNKKIKVFGYVDDKTKTKILSSSKLFVFPSHEEGWGIAVAEAMSYGLPIVCWDLENLKEVFKNNLLYIKSFNYQYFSQKIIDLINNPNQIKIIGNNNIKYVKHFSWQKITSEEFTKIKSIYEKK